MIGVILCTLIFLHGVARSWINPWIGIATTYFWIALDPQWHWHWILPHTRYQFYLVMATAVGFFLTLSSNLSGMSSVTKKGICAGVCMYLWHRVCTATSIAPETSYAFMEVFGKVLLLTLFTIVVVKTTKQINTLLFLGLAGISYFAYEINNEYLHLGWCRYVRGSLGSHGFDNNTFSISSLPFMSVGLAFALGSKSLVIRIISIFASLLCLQMIFLLESRGAFVSIAVTTAILVLKAKKSKLNWVIILSAAIVASALAGERVVEEWKSIFASKENRDESAEARLELWSAGIQLTRTNPIYGVGPNAARHLVPQMLNLTREEKALHNCFLDISSGTGLPGFVFFLIFSLLPWLYCYRNYDRNNEADPLTPIKLTVISGLPSYWIASLFSSVLLSESSWFLIAIGYIVTNIEAMQSPMTNSVVDNSTEPIGHHSDHNYSY